MPEIPPNPEVPQVRDLRPKVLGVLPQNAQARVLAGIALLMVLVILFSGKSPNKEHAPGKAASAGLDLSPSQVQDYRARIEAESQKLAAEEAELAHTKQAIQQAAPAPGAPEHRAVRAQAFDRSASPEPFAQERAKREYQSLFASSIALSYRATAKPASAPPPPAPAPESAPTSPLNRDAAVVTETPKYHLFEGTILESVLTNRLDSTFSGPVNCMLTTSLYSKDSGHLLIPQGTRVLGEARKLEALGQQRLAVVFHRLIMPDGYSVSLDQFHGLDQIGETGLRDLVNHHYLQIFGVSLAIGAFAGLAQTNTRYGVNENATDAYQQGVTSSLSQSALHILDRYLNVLPTFTIREGYRVKIYLSGDLLLPAYDDHPVRKDL